MEQVRIDRAKTVKDVLADANVVVRIQGYIQGCASVSDRDLGNGLIEVELELPLNGPAGLKRLLSE